MAPRSLLIKQNDELFVAVIDSVETSDASGEIIAYNCLPKGMKFKSEMDKDIHSLETFHKFRPQIILEFNSTILFNLLESVEKLELKDELILPSLLASFCAVDYQYNSSVIERLIFEVFQQDVFICCDDDEDDSTSYFIRFCTDN